MAVCVIRPPFNIVIFIIILSINIIIGIKKMKFSLSFKCWPSGFLLLSSLSSSSSLTATTWSLSHCHHRHQCKTEDYWLLQLVRYPEQHINSQRMRVLVGCLLACLTSQQHASVSQGQICSDKFTCCHTEMEVAYQTFCLTQSQYTNTGPTSPSTDPIMPGSWQGSH